MARPKKLRIEKTPVAIPAPVKPNPRGRIMPARWEKFGKELPPEVLAKRFPRLFLWAVGKQKILDTGGLLPEVARKNPAAALVFAKDILSEALTAELKAQHGRAKV